MKSHDAFFAQKHDERDASSDAAPGALAWGNAKIFMRLVSALALLRRECRVDAEDRAAAPRARSVVTSLWRGDSGIISRVTGPPRALERKKDERIVGETDLGDGDILDLGSRDLERQVLGTNYQMMMFVWFPTEEFSNSALKTELARALGSGSTIDVSSVTADDVALFKSTTQETQVRTPASLA